MAAVRHEPLLDGWRALSILLVVAGHLLPAGPPSWGGNATLNLSGMAIFFTLSGFLICRGLLRRPDVRNFLVRRLFRIVPLAWAAMAVLAVCLQASPSTLLRNLSFTANVPPIDLLNPGGGHLWSLCVEMQFYLFVALVVSLGGRRALLVLPGLALLVTTIRVFTASYASIETPYRVDEILAGGSLALFLHYVDRERLARRVPAGATVVLLTLLLLSANPNSGPLNYGRPYLAAAAVGCSLLAAPAVMKLLLGSRPARYLADISYAVYVVHMMLAATWLGGPFGQGTRETLERYAKRPLLFAAIWLVAHCSTNYFEKPITSFGRRLADRIAPPRSRTGESVAGNRQT